MNSPGAVEAGIALQPAAHLWKYFGSVHRIQTLLLSYFSRHRSLPSVLAALSVACELQHLSPEPVAGGGTFSTITR